jgi:CubicO group peptidase (beta-lactamase class C family)
VCLSGQATMSAGQPPADDLARAVDTISEAALRELRLPSLSIAIARGSRVLLAKAYGLAEVEHDVRASERTVYEAVHSGRDSSSGGTAKIVAG